MPRRTRAQFIVNSKGRKTAVILPIREFDAMVRELEDLRGAQYVDEAEVSSQGFVELSELRKSLTKKKRQASQSSQDRLWAERARKALEGGLASNEETRKLFEDILGADPSRPSI